jgi:hypothetical protein
MIPLNLIFGLPGRIVLGLIAAFVVYKSVQYSGVRKERVRVERQDTANVKNADAAARSSREPGSRGVLDPYVRHD